MLLKKDTPVTNNSKIAKTLNNYFKNVVNSLEIPGSENTDKLNEQRETATLNAIVKFRQNPSIKAIDDSFSNRSLSFSTIEKKDLLMKSISLVLIKIHLMLIFQYQSVEKSQILFLDFICLCMV